MFRLTDDLSPDIVMMLLFSLSWVHREGCWHSWHKLNFSAEHIKPSGPLRRPLVGVFDIFRHGFTQPKKQREPAIVCEQPIEGSAVVIKASSVFRSKKATERSNRTWTWQKSRRRTGVALLSFRPIFRSASGLLGVAFQTHPHFTGGWPPALLVPSFLPAVTQSPHTGLWHHSNKDDRGVSVVTNYEDDFCRRRTLASRSAGGGTKVQTCVCGVTTRLRCGNTQLPRGLGKIH